MVEISLGSHKFSVSRPKLRKWLTAEKYRGNAIDSADKKDDFGFITGIVSFLSALVPITTQELETLPWFDVLESYYLASLENVVRLDLSMIQHSKKEPDDKLPDAWEYDERVWYSWLHILATTYGWNIEYISELDVDDAFALVQEISLQEQFEREWQYGLSEVAYEFDKSTNKSRLRPLTRPVWMRQATKSVQKTIENRSKVVVRTPKSFVPPGIVILDGQETSTDEHTRGTSGL